MPALARRLAAVVLALLPALLPASASAQSGGAWPSKPVRLIVPIAPGGATDVLARMLTAHYEKRLGQPFVIENRPGALSQLGTEAVVKSAPDGYSLLLTSIQVASEEALNPAWPIRFERDLTSISMFAGGGYAIAVKNALPVKSIRDLIDYSKANPGKLNQAQSGGLSTDMAILLHRLGAGPVESILYKGGPLAIQAVAAGEADWFGAAVIDALPLHKAGKLRIIAYSERQRHPLLAEIPTVNESAGIDDYDASFWFLLAGPAGLPREIVTKLHGATQEATREPEFVARVSGYGMRTLDFTPDQARERIVTRINLLKKLAAEGVKLR